MSEKVVNRPLSGNELKEVLRRAFQKLLDNEGLLADRVAYGRCAFQIRLTLQTGNVHWPESTSEIDSSRHNPLADPALPRPEALPLANPPADTALGSTEISQKVDSPNVERLRAGMPIPVDRNQQDGTKITEWVKYPEGDAAEPDPAVFRDTTDAVRKELKL